MAYQVWAGDVPDESFDNLAAAERYAAKLDDYYPDRDVTVREIEGSSKLSNDQAMRFGHLVYALMNGTEWDSDTFSQIAVIADAVGREFDEMEDDEFIVCAVCNEPVTIFDEGSDRCIHCESKD